MKFRYVLIMLVAFAGFGASLALADDGHGKNGENGAGKSDCKHGAVLGTISAPQSFTLTVVKASDQTGFKPGQTVTVSLGSQGQQVRIVAEGCVGTDGTITVHEAELHARNPNAGKHEGHDHGGTTTTAGDSTTTTTGDSTTTTHQ
jgi:hypothetical protein